MSFDPNQDRRQGRQSWRLCRVWQKSLFRELRVCRSSPNGGRAAPVNGITRRWGKREGTIEQPFLDDRRSSELWPLQA